MYLRIKYEDTSISISLLTSRTRVTPLTKVTIPQLELCGAASISRLQLRGSTDKLFAWTYSMIVYAWVGSTTSHLKVFVANRFQETIVSPPSSDLWCVYSRSGLWPGC